MLAVAILAHGCACATPPPDEELLREVLSDPRMQEIERVLDGFSGPMVSAEELGEYRRKLDRTGVRSVESWHRIADWPVEFVLYDYVLYHDGIRKGFAWCECTPDPVLPSPNGRKRHEREAFRHITGNWYLFFAPT